MVAEQEVGGWLVCVPNWTKIPKGDTVFFSCPFFDLDQIFDLDQKGPEQLCRFLVVTSDPLYGLVSLVSV